MITSLIAAIWLAVLPVAAVFGRRRRVPSAARVAQPPAPQPPGPPPEARALEIIDRISEGVLVLDEALRPIFSNSSARTMLGFQEDRVSRVPSEEVLAIARRVQRYGHEATDVVNLWFPYRSTIKVRVSPLPDHHGILVVLRDVTEEVLAQTIRKEFVAHASHELKSPVAGLQTLAEAVMQAVEDDPATAARFAQRLTEEAGRLGRLITDLLDLSRLEDPAHIPDEATDLSAIAHHELNELEDGAKAKQIDLEDGIQPGVWVKGDRQQLALMLRNVLENAVRYTPDGGTVCLKVRPDDGTAAVTVSDTGIGIPLDAQARVFERFYRVDRARSRDRGGTGLGLAIVKHVAELHGGEVSVESELGRGSAFTIRLPLTGQPKSRAAGGTPPGGSPSHRSGGSR